MQNNNKLVNAKANPNDEFETLMCDIEAELPHYSEFFKGKIIYCNCDNPSRSNFWKYFRDNFDNLGLKRLVSTYLSVSSPAFKTEYDGKTETKTPLRGDGSFLSPECIDILNGCDVVITNPPFSLLSKFAPIVIDSGKQFLFLGHISFPTFKDISKAFLSGKIHLGANDKGGSRAGNAMRFLTPDGNLSPVGAWWYTNLPVEVEHKPFKLKEDYSPNAFPKYDNKDAINVDRATNIPRDYFDTMGVPITFLDKLDPSQFEVVGFRKGDDGKDLRVNGKCPFARMLIKRRPISDPIL